MPEPHSDGRRAPPAQRGFERAMFASRWLLAPFYLGLAASGREVTVAVPALVDLLLLGNLVLMVMLARYETFVARFIHLTFMLATLLLALMDRVSARAGH